MTLKSTWDVDNWNDRVVAYLPEITESNFTKLKKMNDQQRKGKIIIYTKADSNRKLAKFGFEIESKMSGFFQGESAQIYTLYNKPDRKKSPSPKKNLDVLRIVEENQLAPSQKWTNISFLSPANIQLEEMTKLYKKVFFIYPTDITDPNYLKKAIVSNDFVIAMDGQKVIGVASAMKTGYGSAEITDCAVDPAYRGKNILHGIIAQLEQKLVEKGIINVFSITRSASVGMNMTVKRLSYSYEGTLINNCQISTGFEDMNIWTKRLKCDSDI